MRVLERGVLTNGCWASDRNHRETRRLSLRSRWEYGDREPKAVRSPCKSFPVIALEGESDHRRRISDPPGIGWNSTWSLPARAGEINRTIASGYHFGAGFEMPEGAGSSSSGYHRFSRWALSKVSVL